MFSRLKDQLTHYPLLWNTRVTWVLGIAGITHLLFFLAGFGTVTVDGLQDYYSLSEVRGAGVYTFSILCSIGFIILWLVFYLRNNAFKNFYIIDKYYSVKEFCIILVIIFFSITFFESYRLGASLKTRTITSKAELVREVNIANLAAAFIPKSKSEYFILSNCDEVAYWSGVQYDEGRDYSDTTNAYYNDTNSIKIRKALKRKDAFSYKNYCRSLVKLEGYENFIFSKDWVATKNRWIDEGRTDSIKYILQEFQHICKKYSIEHNITPAELSKLPFVDSFHNITKTFPSSSYDSDNRVTDYVGFHSLSRALDFVEECHLNSNNSDGHIQVITIEIYVALCLSILLLCYRMYSKRVFLFSIIGTIVWSIIFALIGVSSANGESVAWFYLILFTAFLIMSIASLKSGGSKTWIGVMLNWHIYMLPFVIMLIVFLIEDSYDSAVTAYRMSMGGYQYIIPDELLREKFPVGYWVDHHVGLIFRLNLLFVFLYTAFLFTRLSKKWHIMPEE